MAYDEREEHSGSPAKTYYVSVGAGQVLEDPHAAPYELVIEATDEEIARLQEMFGELASVDEAEMLHFGTVDYYDNQDQIISGSYDETLDRIYRLLYACGTDETKRLISAMQLF